MHGYNMICNFLVLFLSSALGNRSSFLKHEIAISFRNMPRKQGTMRNPGSEPGPPSRCTCKCTDIWTVFVSFAHYWKNDRPKLGRVIRRSIKIKGKNGPEKMKLK